MKLSFKLGKKGTIVICTLTIISVLLALILHEFAFYAMAGIALYAFYTCSRSDAFCKDPEVAWLVAISSIGVSIIVVIVKLIYFMIAWVVHLAIKTPPAKFPFGNGKPLL